MPSLEIRLLGPWQIRLGDDPVAQFATKKVGALLAYLAVEADHAHGRGHLAGLLWPEQPEAAARQNLRQSLVRLRRVIPPDFLLVTRQSIQFNPASDYRLDVTAFAELTAACRSHQHRDLIACQPCIARLQQGVTLYQGDFLAHLYLEDSPPFEAWALQKREWLRRETLQALFHLATHFEQRGAFDAARRYARRQVQLDPLREEAHQQLMRLLAKSGRRSEALTQYETCRQLLAAELRIEPAEETRALYLQIRAEKVAATPSRPGTLALRHNLSRQSTPFFGRETERSELLGLLAKPDLRLITILGPGGIGKTRLALAVAAAQLDHAKRDPKQPFLHGIYFVSLARLDTPETISVAVAEALDFTFYEGESPQQQLFEYLRQKNLLLIMDNFEHLLTSPEERLKGGAEWVVDLLRTAPGIKVLATSRARLNVAEEQRFPITGIDFPLDERETADQITNSSAVKLFLQSARRVQPSFELTAGNLGSVADICRLVQGMPLGILLAATWVELLTPAEIAAEIRQGLNILAADWRDIPRRHQSLSAVFDRSWEILSTRERKVFQRLSVFRGGFTRLAAKAVTDASLRELRALVNKSLLQPKAAGRYGFHELLRQYAVEKLARQSAELSDVRDRHCAFYTAAWPQWLADLKGVRQQASLAAIEAEYENARAAWNWAVNRRNLACLDQMVEGLCLFYDLRFRLHEGEDACRRAATTLDVAEDGAATLSEQQLRLLIKIVAWQSVFSRGLGRPEQANQLLQQGLSLLDSPILADQDTRGERAFVLLKMGEAALDDDREQARQYAQRSLAFYQDLGDDWQTAQAYALLGNVVRKLGYFGEAKRFLERSLSMRRKLGDMLGQADSLILLGWIDLRTAQAEKGVSLARQGHAILEQSGVPASIAHGNLELGKILMFHGQFGESIERMQAGLEIYSDLGLLTSIAETQLWLATTKIHLGHFTAARVQLERSMPVLQVGEKGPFGFAQQSLAQVAMAAGEYEQAKQLLAGRLAIQREIGESQLEGSSLALLGYVARGMGDDIQAQNYLFEALRIGKEAHSIVSSEAALSLMALLQADRGDIEWALELYSLATRWPLIRYSRWYEHVVGRNIAAAAATLSEEVVTAAKERGYERDLWATVDELLEQS